MKIKFNLTVFLLLAFMLFSCTKSFSKDEIKDTPKTSSAAIIDLQKNVHDVAENVTPAVVFISIEKTLKGQSGDPFEFFFNKPNNKNGNPPANDYKQRALGSGVIYSKKGGSYYIITNNHVVEDVTTITLTINQKDYKATLVGADKATDIAVIKIETNDNLSVAKFGDSNNLLVGDFVIAIGNPFGLSGTMTFGIISALGRDEISGDAPTLTNFIQTDASINQGNSGGALINMNGEVIGINSMIYSQSGGSVGIGFAIPVNIVKKVAVEFVDNGKKTIDHGYLGVQFEELTAEKIKTLDVKNLQFGMMVREVMKGGPAEKAGLKIGDVIIEANGKQLKKSSDLTMLVGNANPGDKMSFTIIRDSQEIKKDVVLGNRIELEKVNATAKDLPSTKLSSYGLSVADITSSIRSMNKLPDAITGVIVTVIEKGSPAEQVGILAGDVIYKVNNKKISSVAELNKLIDNNKDKSGYYFFIYRDGREFIVTM